MAYWRWHRSSSRAPLPLDPAGGIEASGQHGEAGSITTRGVSLPGSAHAGSLPGCPAPAPPAITRAGHARALLLSGVRYLGGGPRNVRLCSLALALTSTFARYKDFCTLLLHVTKHVNIQHSFLVIKCCRVFEMLEVYHKFIKRHPPSCGRGELLHAMVAASCEHVKSAGGHSGGYRRGKKSLALRLRCRLSEA